MKKRVEVNLRKTKWQSFPTYHSPSQVDEYYFDEVGKSINKYSQVYVTLLLRGGSDAGEYEPALVQFSHD